jgi:hypothetical protein
VIYRPLALFFYIGSLFMAVGVVAGARFLYYYVANGGEGHIQSVILASLCITLGTILYMMGLIGDLIATNRKLMERMNVRLQHLEFQSREQDKS